MSKLRKFLLITHLDGEVYEKDIEQLGIMLKIPIGAPANHPTYMELARVVATQGYSVEVASPPVWIAPAQIRRVSVVIETQQNLKIS